MKNPLLALTICSFLQPAFAQVQDIGLTMDGGLLTVIFGQDCGPATCTPLFGSVVAAGSSRSVTHYSAPTTLYAVALGLPGPCLTIPGLANPFLLQNPIVFDVGVTSTPPFVPLPCQQGIAITTLTLPPGVPPNTVFRLQSFGESLNGQLGFSAAIEATVQ